MNHSPLAITFMELPAYDRPYNFPLNRPAPAEELEPAPIQRTLALTTASYSTIPKNLSPVQWPQSLSLKIQRTLFIWRIIVEDHTSANELFLQSQNARLEFQSKEYIVHMIQDVSYEKATATLERRGASLLKFSKWSRSTFGTPPFPVQENRSYQVPVAVADGYLIIGELPVPFEANAASAQIPDSQNKTIDFRNESRSVVKRFIFVQFFRRDQLCGTKCATAM